MKINKFFIAQFSPGYCQPVSPKAQIFSNRRNLPSRRDALFSECLCQWYYITDFFILDCILLLLRVFNMMFSKITTFRSNDLLSSSGAEGDTFCVASCRPSDSRSVGHMKPAELKYTKQCVTSVLTFIQSSISTEDYSTEKGTPDI
jgi:hypothetical protein